MSRDIGGLSFLLLKTTEKLNFRIPKGKPLQQRLFGLLILATVLYFIFALHVWGNLARPWPKKASSLFCLVLTTNNSLSTRAEAVNDTWGKRCDKTLFFTNENASRTNVVYLPSVQNGRKHLTDKVMKSFQYVHQYHHEYDWYLKADDDTYIIVDNLRILLSRFKYKEPVYLGQKFKFFTKQGYNSGGAGYVISKQALELLIEGIKDNKTCASDGNDEDVDVGKCLYNQGVVNYNTTDRLDRETFHGGKTEDHIAGPLSDLLKRYPSTKARTGRDCCSTLTVSFHYVSPKFMRILDILLYHVTVYGRNYNKDIDVFK